MGGLILLLASPCVVSAGYSAIMAQHPTPSASMRAHARVLVPGNVAALVRPILDLREASVKECGEPGSGSRCARGDAYRRDLERERRLNDMLQQLVERRGPDADEALVVLMCFCLGESQEDADAVIRRGRHMLSYLNKYRRAVPSIPDRAYPKSMLKDASSKENSFRGAVTAIKRGWRGTWDNPEG